MHTKESSRSAPLRGRGTPAYPARLRSERARNSYKTDRAKIVALLFHAVI